MRTGILLVRDALPPPRSTVPVKTRHLGDFSASVLLVLSVVVVSQAHAQSASQVGAWDGLMLTPVGALAPVASDPGGLRAGDTAWSLRYGRWRYDADDAVHDTGGVTWTRGFAFAHTLLSLTGAYGLIECPTCYTWIMGGIDLQSSLWSHAVADSAGRQSRVTAVLARLSAGGGRYRGPNPVNTLSFAATLPIELSVPLRSQSALRVSVLPGVGFGHVASLAYTEAGLLPMIGGALAWSVTRSFDVNVGVQRLLISGGVYQVGMALTWSRGNQREGHP